MKLRAEEISSIIEKQIAGFDSKVDVREVGTVLTVGDGIARVHGMENARAGELLEFPGGVIGISTPNQRSILDLLGGLMYRLTGGHLTKPLEKFYIEQHFLYFSPDTLRDAIERAHLAPLLIERELTDLRRLSLSPPVRLLLETMFAASRLTGLENRLFAIAR